MDDIAKYNKEKWNRLVDANVEFSRPWDKFSREEIRKTLDWNNILPPDIQGQKVLCLASGGGQQSIAFSMLGADATVFDLSDNQLERDRITAKKLGLNLTIVQGDMRDLSTFPDRNFDIVWHPYSVNFVPELEKVVRGVSRICKPHGYYYFQMGNPFTAGINETDWKGDCYPLRRYIDKEDVSKYHPEWEIWEDGKMTGRVHGPREFRHSLITIMNSIIESGFEILKFWEEPIRDIPDLKPGNWDHFAAYVPILFYFWLWKK